MILAASKIVLVALHVILVAEDVCVRRVEYRAAVGGHTVPEEKIRERYRRLWALVAEARRIAGRTIVYDNSLAAEPFRVVASYERGIPVREPRWPSWTPATLRD